MNVLLIAVVGCVLMALGLMMLANRAGYVYFVVGPRSVLVLAGWSRCSHFGLSGLFLDMARRWREMGRTRAAL
jgi:hypothetical protein